MLGLMQDWPLLLSKVLTFAARWHGEAQIVSRTIEGPIHRTNYAELYRRTCRLAHAMRDKLGVEKGGIVATMAWNSYRHMEIWYALMGQGAIVHTLNPRLFADQLAYIINHAEDQWIFVDLTFVPILEKLQDKLPKVKGFVIMTDAAHMPQTSLRNVLCYEELLAEDAEEFDWPEFDENTACGLCYTSGTTGNPKGVLYSHRSNILHALAALTSDFQGLGAADRVLPVVPMFHVNAWALPFMAPMVGADLIMPGAKLDSASLYELLVTERVTTTSAVPTIWLGLLQYLDEDRTRLLPDLNRVMIGGSACPEAIMRTFQERYGVEVRHAWGMTETSPVGALAKLKGSMGHLSEKEQWSARLKQGRPPFMVDLKITDDGDTSLPHDGKAFGRLKVKGPFVASGYFKAEGGETMDADGWFDTGDVATVDPWGFMQITDRNKDVIKSGGEWISSIELENAAVGCEGVAEAAAIGLPHPKWDERPMLVIVKKPNANLTKEHVFAHLDGKIAKWWMPDDVAFVDEIPHTATGKISKLQLRERFRDHQLPTVAR
jgi:acyl-CoA synthetase (AMP-forming)/AMP-acid ligase II